ncbi:MAG: PA14 domain-containing protein, partial [Phycisphaerales bacterium]
NYTFYTTSDDGSQLFIDGAMVVDNDGTHGMVEQSGTVSLSAGLHDIVVTMFELGGGEGLDVEWEGPVIAREAVPDDVLSLPSPAADLNGDGAANFKDFALLLDQWLEKQLWPEW